jgi:hypothetical protein
MTHQLLIVATAVDWDVDCDGGLGALVGSEGN